MIRKERNVLFNDALIQSNDKVTNILKNTMTLQCLDPHCMFPQIDKDQKVLCYIEPIWVRIHAGDTGSAVHSPCNVKGQGALLKLTVLAFPLPIMTVLPSKFCQSPCLISRSSGGKAYRSKTCLVIFKEHTLKLKYWGPMTQSNLLYKSGHKPVPKVPKPLSPPSYSTLTPFEWMKVSWK